MADNSTTSETVTYAQIAEQYGLKVPSLRVYAANDPAFPASINNSGVREFDRAEVEAYFEQRKNRTGHGRPNTGAAARVEISPAEIAKLRSEMKAHQITTAVLSEIIGTTRATADSRLHGRTRWLETEVQAIAEFAEAEGMKRLGSWAQRQLG